MTPLERGQLGVIRFGAVANAFILLVTAAAAEAFLLAQAPVVPFGFVIAPVALLLVYTVLIAPARQYRAWGYALADDELRIAFGLITRVQTHVPLARVQHVDVVQGPIERAFRVCRLVLHTAGTANSRVVLPGLSRATAEAIRDEVRARIGGQEE